MYKSITMIVLLLNQIKQEQTEYIICINDKFYHLNTETISKKILADIQHKKYIHILISFKLAINDKFCEIVTHSIFKK